MKLLENIDLDIFASIFLRGAYKSNIVDFNNGQYYEALEPFCDIYCYDKYLGNVNKETATAIMNLLGYRTIISNSKPSKYSYSVYDVLFRNKMTYEEYNDYSRKTHIIMVSDNLENIDYLRNIFTLPTSNKIIPLEYLSSNYEIDNEIASYFEEYGFIKKTTVYSGTYYEAIISNKPFKVFFSNIGNPCIEFEYLGEKYYEISYTVTHENFSNEEIKAFLDSKANKNIRLSCIKEIVEKFKN